MPRLPRSAVRRGLIFLLLILLPTPLFAQGASILAVETSSLCGGSYDPGVMLVDPSSGNRKLLIGVEDQDGSCVIVGSGAFPDHIYRLGSDLDGDLLVADGDGASSRILEIDLATGSSVVLSGCTVPAGSGCGGPILGSGAIGTLLGDVVVVDSAAANNSALVEGDILVAMSRYALCSVSADALIRVDRSTGDRLTLSGLDGDCSTIVGTGDDLVEANGILLRDDGTVLIADGDGGIGRLVSIDPQTGNRTVLSGCSDADGSSCLGSIIGSGPDADFASSLVPLAGSPGRVAARVSLVSSCFGGGTILSFDLTTGDRTVLAGDDEFCAQVGAGPAFYDLESLSASPAGEIAVSEDSGVDRIMSVDPITGARAVIGGCSALDASGDCIGPTIGTGPTPRGYGTLTYLPEPSASLLLGPGILGLVSLGRAKATRAAPSVRCC